MGAIERLCVHHLDGRSTPKCRPHVVGPFRVFECWRQRGLPLPEVESLVRSRAALPTGTKPSFHLCACTGVCRAKRNTERPVLSSLQLTRSVLHPPLLLAMDPLAGMDSSTDDDAASQTTEDDPQVPENREPPPPAPPPQPPRISSSSDRARPHYELKHTMRGHTSSISAVKFSPDGTLLASCGVYHCTLRSIEPSSSYVRMLQRTTKW